MSVVRIILTIVEAAACLTVSVIAVNKLLGGDVPCDSCSNLITKRRPNSSEHRFECARRGRFDCPPSYCRMYCKREEGRKNKCSHDVHVSDVAEVVRCRDCMYRVEDSYCMESSRFVDDDGFCEKGK